ncbi:MAG: hypothetical protein QW794_00650 [Thermosphaera sp.]
MASWSWEEFVRLDPTQQKRIVFSDDGDLIIDLLDMGIITVQDFEVDDEEKEIRFRGLWIQEDPESPLPVQGWIRPPLDDVERWDPENELQFDFWVIE